MDGRYRKAGSFREKHGTKRRRKEGINTVTHAKENSEGINVQSVGDQDEKKKSAEIAEDDKEVEVSKGNGA